MSGKIQNAFLGLSEVNEFSSSPRMHRSILLAVHRQVSSLVWIFRGQRFIDIHTQARGFSRMHEPVFERVRVWKYFVRVLTMPHVFLNTEIVNTEVEVQGRRHADRTQVRCAMRPRTNLVHLGQAGNFSQMGNATRVHHRRANVVNQVLLDQLLAIENRIEYLTNRQRSSGVPPDQPKALLQLGRSRVFQPEKMIGFEFFAKTSSLNGSQTMMCIMEQVDLGPKFLAQSSE